MAGCGWSAVLRLALLKFLLRNDQVEMIFLIVDDPVLFQPGKLA